jgi:hypothetical protein
MVIVPWLAEIILISWRDLLGHSKSTPGDKRLPWPSELLYTFVLFGVLSVLPGQGQRVGAAIGWGVVVATLLQVWSPVNPTQVSSPQNPVTSLGG